MTLSTMTEPKDRYQAIFETFARRAEGDGGAWFAETRREAMVRFTELGFPTPKNEDWRFTNTAPIARTPFRPASEGRVLPSREALAPFAVADLAGPRLVFVDGHFAPELSTAATLPDGVRVMNLGEAMAGHRDLVEKHLARHADFRQDAFLALNTAFLEDGLFLHVPRGVVMKGAIHALFVSTTEADPTLSHPRNLILIDENAQANVLEDYVSLGQGSHFSNVVTELVAGDNAVVGHYLLERESLRSYNVSTLRIRQGRASNVSSHSVLVGGALVRNNVHPVMAGEGGLCLVNGLYLGTGEQHLDNYMMVEHASPHCDSRQFYNGILDRKARGVFHGRIKVHKPAQKTDAKQTNKNLLLSHDASIDTKPQLEIYADDVKCTHGATIGQMDEEAIFYLRARGISESAARAMLLLAFARERLDRMGLEPIRRQVETMVSEWFTEAGAGATR